MNRYYLLQGEVQTGPHSAAELKNMGIKPTKLVRTADWPGWIEAQSVPELRTAIFGTLPRAIPAYAGKREART